MFQIKNKSILEISCKHQDGNCVTITCAQIIVHLHPSQSFLKEDISLLMVQKGILAVNDAM